MIINEPRETSWGARFPQILNLLAIPVADKKLSGWVLAFNKRRAAARGAGGREARMSPSAGRGEAGAGRLPDPAVPPLGRGAAHAVRLAARASTCGPPGATSTSRTCWSG